MTAVIDLGIMGLTVAAVVEPTVTWAFGSTASNDGGVVDAIDDVPFPESPSWGSSLLWLCVSASVPSVGSRGGVEYVDVGDSLGGTSTLVAS
eukprot:CAMPEP_0184681142 /NCGR_PEP_ID=MMETSP0312-20130426/4097_1 /TAXON_ID=31354 /ORGANISM="Compsopogon coeruleus, Strain SAG 36.94" /LENGTH=91 /DNA_ID=CAMNT_0027131773 /DNA_START=206 /DNA_END=482 /DNA_ORIENTATION=-